MRRTGLLFLLVFLAMPVKVALAGCRWLCRPEIARCHFAGYTRASCRRVLMAQCRASGGAVCVFVPPTTTTTTLATTTTVAPTTTTTTTLPAGPDFSVYSGTWGYAASFQNYAVCPTHYSTQLSGTLQLTVNPQGSIIGSVDSAIAIAGSFTSLSSASVSSQVYSDVWGCGSTFDADITSFTTTQGVLDVYIYQQCPGEPVCADHYVGAVAR